MAAGIRKSFPTAIWPGRNNVAASNDSKYETFEHEKLRLMKTASELGYSVKVVDALYNCKTSNELARVMTSARHGEIK